MHPWLGDVLLGESVSLAPIKLYNGARKLFGEAPCLANKVEVPYQGARSDTSKESSPVDMICQLVPGPIGVQHLDCEAPNHLKIRCYVDLPPPSLSCVAVRLKWPEENRGHQREIFVRSNNDYPSTSTQNVTVV
jgi:hypothetical protein